MTLKHLVVKLLHPNNHRGLRKRLENNDVLVSYCSPCYHEFVHGDRDTVQFKIDGCYGCGVVDLAPPKKDLRKQYDLGGWICKDHIRKCMGERYHKFLDYVEGVGERV